MAETMKYTLEQVGSAFHLVITVYLMSHGYTPLAQEKKGFFIRLWNENKVIIDSYRKSDLSRMAKLIRGLDCLVEEKTYEPLDGSPVQNYLLIRRK